MKKLLYTWYDWGLYGIEEVEVLEEGLTDQKYPNSKFAIVLLREGKDCHRLRLKVNMKELFDTKEEAEEYARKNCPTGAF